MSIDTYVSVLEHRTLFALTTFTIDPALSTLRLSGEVADVLDVEEQSNGSLLQNYEGAILADLEAGVISFPGGSNIVARATKSYDPGDGPANYGIESETGGFVSVKVGEAAVRNFAFDLRSAANLAVSDAGAFGAGGLDVRTTGGVLEYDLRVGGDGDVDLDDENVDNDATGNATLRGEGANRTLTIPVDFTLGETESTELRFRGTLVATTGTGAPVDPNAIRIGDGTLLRSVQYTDADGTVTTITLSGGGSADVRFTNASQLIPGRPGTAAVSGTGVELLGIDATGTTSRTKLLATAKGGADGIGVVKQVTTDGSMGSIGGRGVHLADAVTVNGTLGSVTAARMTGVKLTAESVGTIKVAGEVSFLQLTLSAPFAAGQLALRSFTSGDFFFSRISAAGAIGNVKVRAMSASEIHSGVANADVDFPTTAELSSDGAVASVTVKTFNDSAIAADTLGRVKLGFVNTDSVGTPFGLTADVIGALQAANDSRERLRLTLVDDPAVLAAQLAAQPFAAGDFTIRLA